MSLQEGVRRLGLVAGTLGACAGAAFSIVQLSDLRHREARHAAFQHLAQSPAVQKQVTTIKSLAIPTSGTPDYATLAKQVGGAVHSSAPITPPPGYTLDSRPTPDIFNQIDASQKAKAVEAAESALAGSTDGWWVVRDDISKIYFDGRTKSISRIDTIDGQKLNDEAAPSTVDYLVLLAFPLAGFLLPWGLFKTAAWVGAGFAKT